MGLSLNYILYLQRNGHLTPVKNAILDFGPQNVFYATAEQIREIVTHQGRQLPDPSLIASMVGHSIPGRKFKHTFFSEIAACAGIEYRAIDVCTAPATDIVDLNIEALPPAHIGCYDVVLNFGTTEHIFNQLNSFKSLHEAAKIGGIIYCQLPATGYFEHGYFCYTPLFFRDLAKANDYEIVDSFLTMAGRSNLKELGIDIRSAENPYDPCQIGDGDTTFSYFNFNVVMRRRSEARFRVGLEVATSHAAIDRALLERYGDPHLLEKIKQMEQSISWRITAPFRFGLRAAKAVKRRVRMAASKFPRLPKSIRS
jgi:hypothetical protein